MFVIMLLDCHYHGQCFKLQLECISVINRCLHWPEDINYSTDSFIEDWLETCNNLLPKIKYVMHTVDLLRHHNNILPYLCPQTPHIHFLVKNGDSFDQSIIIKIYKNYYRTLHSGISTRLGYGKISRGIIRWIAVSNTFHTLLE